MPDPFHKAKMTGDTHPPEVESDLPLEAGSSAGEPGVSGTAAERGRAAIGRVARPGRGIKKGGLLRDSEDAGQPGDASGDRRDA